MAILIIAIILLFLWVLYIDQNFASKHKVNTADESEIMWEQINSIGENMAWDAEKRIKALEKRIKKLEKDKR